MWDLICLVSWGGQVLYLCNELGHTGLSLSVKPNHLGATEDNNSVLPISNAEETLCHLHPTHFVPAPLDDSYPLPAPYFSLLLCYVTQGPNLFWLTLQKTLLGNWCQRGRESSHQSLILQKGERMLETAGEKNYIPQMLGVQEERSHMSLEGKDMFMLFVCLLCSDFLFPIFSQYPI